MEEMRKRTATSRMGRIARMLSVAGVLVMGVSAPTVAAEKWHTATVRAIYPQADGSFALALTTDTGDCSAPGNPQYHFVSTAQAGVTEEAVKKFYAAALVAYTTGAPLSVIFSDTTSYCYAVRVYLGS